MRCCSTARRRICTRTRCHTLLRRLHLLDPLRYKLVDIPWRLHHPMWLENCEVDLDYHLRRVQVPSPGGRRELDEVVGQIATTPLDRTRPLWEFHFAEGMAGHRFAIIGKLHHALADGVASANLLARVMDSAGPAQDERNNDVGCVPPSTAELLREAWRDHARQSAALPGVIADTLAGARRLRRRTRERGKHPDLPGCCTHRRPLSTTWSHRHGLSRPRRCRWRK